MHLKIKLRNRDDPRSNLIILDVEISLWLNDIYFRKDGCLAKMLHFVHTGPYSSKYLSQRAKEIPQETARGKIHDVCS
jgi:hypothetical protein